MKRYSTIADDIPVQFNTRKLYTLEFEVNLKPLGKVTSLHTLYNVCMVVTVTAILKSL